MYSETHGIKSDLSNAFEVFKPEFLPWALTFTVATAGISGIVKHYSNQISKMQKEKEEDLLYRATHDDLTGLYNRAALEKQLDYQLVQRNDVETSLFFIDLDGFKQVNDAYGHGDGNKVLKEVADRLSKYFRKSDYICRYGGDEFVIMMDQSHEQNRTLLAERLLKNLSMPYLDDKISFVSCSIGIAVSNNGNTAKNLLSRADSAMYKAKKQVKIDLFTIKLKNCPLLLFSLSKLLDITFDIFQPTGKNSKHATIRTSRASPNNMEQTHQNRSGPKRKVNCQDDDNISNGKK